MTRKAPDEDNWFVEPVVADWWRQYVDDGNMEKAFAIPGTRVRASWAGDCAHAVALHVAGAEVSDPPTVADAWRFNIGTMLHDHVQASIERAFPGSKREVKVRIGEDGSGHMDLWVVLPDGRTVSVEVKSINGYGWRRAIDSRDPEGLRIKFLMQGALNAYSHDPQPDLLLIAVFSLECLSPADAAKHGIEDEYRRFAGQWTFSKEEYSAIAEDEIRRLERIVSIVDERGSDGVPRMIPDPALPHHVVRDPRKGTLEVRNSDGRPTGTGWTWHCGYCPYQSTCAAEMGLRFNGR